jgi:hypothetical protein
MRAIDQDPTGKAKRVDALGPLALRLGRDVVCAPRMTGHRHARSWHQGRGRAEYAKGNVPRLIRRYKVGGLPGRRVTVALSIDVFDLRLMPTPTPGRPRTGSDQRHRSREPALGIEAFPMSSQYPWPRWSSARGQSFHFFGLAIRNA